MLDEALFSKRYIWIDIILPVVVLGSCFRNPMTAQYSKWSFGERVASTKLFKAINQKITFVWGAIFLIQFIVARLLLGHTPFGAIIYVINLLGMVFSYYYPKKKLG